MELKRFTFVMPWHISERGGGAEVQASYLAQELGERGFKVSYICQTSNKTKINTTEVLGSITIYWLKPSGRFPWLDQNKYLKPLNDIKPDYILQRLSSNVTYVLGKYCKYNNCKFVWFCTDNKNPIKNFHYFRFKERYSIKSLGLFKYTTFAINCKIMDFFRVKGMKQVDIAFTQNEFQREQVKRNFNLTSARMISGHPLPKQHIPINRRFENKTILWCANWGVHKRPELFIELAKNMQHTNLKFVMIGGHNNKKYVERLLLNKPKSLLITGRLGFEQALSYFGKATVFVNTSESGGDGFPNTFIQSWLRRVPVISLGFDPDNIIANNNLGFNVNSVKEASDKIFLLLNDYKFYQTLSHNVYMYGKKNHTIKKMTDHFLSVLVNHKPSDVK